MAIFYFHKPLKGLNFDNDSNIDHEANENVLNGALLMVRNR